MSERNLLLFFAVAFLLGVAGAGLVYLKIRPSEPERVQLQIDRAIQDELCERMEKDVSRFKEFPHTFLRSSLQVLLSESRATVKALLAGVPDGFPVQYRGKPSALVSLCQTKGLQWVKIPSAFPEYGEAEAELVGLSPKADIAGIAIPVLGPLESGKQRRRLALVIGNSAYLSRPLKNPVNDAQDMSAVLRATGFDVLELYDADLTGMRSVVNEFSQSLPRYDVGLVYYSGHGIEFGGRNYFLPVNADIKSEEEIPRQGYDATEISEKIGRSNTKTSILIIDACRNNPVFSKFRSATSGLKPMDAASGSIVAFSAAPGQIASDGNGRNSPYTAALLKQIQVPGKKIEDVLKEARKIVSEESGGRQVPWYNSSLAGDFYFIEQ